MITAIISDKRPEGRVLISDNNADKAHDHGFNIRLQYFSVGTSVLSHWVEQPEGEADHSTPPSTEVKNTWSYTSTHPCACMVCTGTIAYPSDTLSKAWLCGRSLAGIAGLNPAGGMNVCLL